MATIHETNYTTGNNSIWCESYDINFLLTQPGKINLIILCAVTILLSAFTIILNGSYIMAVWKNKTLRKSKNDLYILLSLIDMCYGLSMLPVFCYLLKSFITNVPACYLITVWTIIGVDFTTIGFIAVGFITIELYLAVFKPFVYQRWKQKKVLIKIQIILWLPLLGFSIFSADPRQLKSTMNVFGIVTFVVLVYCQKRIQSYIRQNKNRCSEQKKKSAKVALQIIIVFFSCNALGLVSNLNQIIFSSAVVDTFINRWLIFIAFSNTLWDTYIYGLRTRMVRKEVLKLLTCTEVHGER